MIPVVDGRPGQSRGFVDGVDYGRVIDGAVRLKACFCVRAAGDALIERRTAATEESLQVFPVEVLAGHACQRLQAPVRRSDRDHLRRTLADTEGGNAGGIDFGPERQKGDRRNRVGDLRFRTVNDRGIGTLYFRLKGTPV